MFIELTSAITDKPVMVNTDNILYIEEQNNPKDIAKSRIVYKECWLSVKETQDDIWNLLKPYDTLSNNMILS